MTRSLNHPLVRTIVRALDRAEESERLHPEQNGGAVRTTAAAIVEFGESCERFCYPGAKWSPETAGAVVIAFAINCPEQELKRMAAQARIELRELDEWDRVGWYASRNEEPPSKRRAA